MSNKAAKTKAVELLDFGLPKQQVFDNLRMEFPEVKPGKLAEWLRYMPTSYAREKYRTLHFALLAIIVLSAVLRILRQVFSSGVHLDQATAYLSLVPIATLLVGYSIYRWQGQVFEWVGWGNALGAFGLLNDLGELMKDDGDLWTLTGRFLSVSIGGVALYLAHKVFAKPRSVTDPGTGTKTYVFDPEDPV